MCEIPWKWVRFWVAAGVDSQLRPVPIPGCGRCRFSAAAGVDSRLRPVSIPGCGRCRLVGDFRLINADLRRGAALMEDLKQELC